MPAVRKYANSAARQAAYRTRRKARGNSVPNTPAAGAVYHRWETRRKQALDILEQVTGEMEVYHDQRSDAWKDSERGEAFTEKMESITDIVEALRETLSHPSEA